jgi:hypothetical protein
MKMRYVIVLLVVCSGGLLLLDISIIGVLVPIIDPYISRRFGFTHVAIIKSVGVLSSFLSSVAVAFPLGYFTKRNGLIYGFLLPIIAAMFVFGSSVSDFLGILKTRYLELLSLVLFCGVFCHLGHVLGVRTMRQPQGGQQKYLGDAK